MGSTYTPKTRDAEIARTRRNLNPHREARLAMLVWGNMYSRQGVGSMDFWDGLTEGRKDSVRRWLDELESVPREKPS